MLNTRKTCPRNARNDRIARSVGDMIINNEEVMRLDWFLRMNDALDLMEKKMEEPLDIEKIAKAAYSSPFHFHRMFHMLTGLTASPSNYH